MMRGGKETLGAIRPSNPDQGLRPWTPLRFALYQQVFQKSERRHSRRFQGRKRRLFFVREQTMSRALARLIVRLCGYAVSCGEWD